MFRTYPRIPFYEQVHDNDPFFTDTGRMHAYGDVPEAIEYGENFIVHREGPEATPYLPNVIVSSNPLVRPEDYGIATDAEHWDERTDPQHQDAVEQGQADEKLSLGERLSILLLDAEDAAPRALAWSNVDWHHADGLELRRSRIGSTSVLPCVGEHQLHMNPHAARDWASTMAITCTSMPIRPTGLTSARNRTIRFIEVAALMLRVTYNRRYPYNVVMMKHAPFIATEKSVKAHETRPDGRALVREHRLSSQPALRLAAVDHAQLADADASDRHTVSQSQSLSMSFMFGGEADNHAVNTVPKETLVRVTKAEDGGMGGKGIWKPATTGYSPDNENDLMKRYLAGDLTKVKT